MNKRLLYRVILKLLSSVALLLLAVIFINSLFTASKKEESTLSTTASVIALDITGMKSGDIRKTQWEGKEVAVQHRGNKDFFVYINIGDSRNCPLFKEKNGFKDVCTGTRFDVKGREKGNEKHGFKIESPPYYFIKEQLFIGAKGE